MAIRTADAEWQGDLKSGEGRMKLGSGAYEGKYSYMSRMEEGAGTNPEELIAAAHAGCFSMALAAQLAGAGFPARRVHTRAKVHFNKETSGFAITRIELECGAEVPSISQDAFDRLARTAKEGCPVSKALAAVPIELHATLEAGAGARA